MATFYLEDFVHVNSFGGIVATTWQVSTDKFFGTIVEASDLDTNNILTWTVPLVKNRGDKLYARVKIYTSNGDYNFTSVREYNGMPLFESDWFLMTEVDPRNERVKLTHEGKIVGEVEIKEDGSIENIW